MKALMLTCSVAMQFAVLMPIAGAQVPFLSHAVKSFDTRAQNLDQCVAAAESALNAEGLEDMQFIANGVTGRSQDVVVSAVCIQQQRHVAIMLTVAGNDAEQTRVVKEALKNRL